MRPKSYSRIVPGEATEVSAKLAASMREEGFVVLARSEVKPRPLEGCESKTPAVIVIRARYPVTMPGLWLSGEGPGGDAEGTFKLLAVVQELEDDRVSVSVMQPISMLGVAGGPGDSFLTERLNRKLESALDRLIEGEPTASGTA
jgi:hypothetical protein